MDAQFYKGRGNDVLMTLSNNGASVLPASITKVEFKYSGGSVNSVDDPELFTFETNGIRLKFGGLTVQAGLYEMSLIVYSADHPEGIVWDASISIKVDEL